VLHAGRNQAVCRCDVFVVAAGAAETLCAVGQGTIARLSEGQPDARRAQAADEVARPMNSRSDR
jgi:hypothetical protein